MNRDLLSRDLFGNDAGEDENKERLNDYYFYKNDLSPFLDKDNNLQFVRARKGMGKSALINYMSYSMKNDKDILITLKASELLDIQDLESSNPLTSISNWKRRICSRINMEIAKTIKFAASDNKITLVETAELTGFRDQNLFSALFDRFKLKIGPIDSSITKKQIQNSQEHLARFADNGKKDIWIFIDDIDATFQNLEESKLLVSTFFTACRDLVNEVNGLFIRASVRTDVWSIIKSFDESLDKCEQYMLDLYWSVEDTGMILCRKLLSYYRKYYPSELLYKGLDPVQNQSEILGFVLQKTFKWGIKKTIPTYYAIHHLCAGRPRWAVQLCRIAAKKAGESQNKVITPIDLNYAITELGKSRISDLHKEHGHQCSDIRYLLEIFRKKEFLYTTPELLNVIRENVIDRNRNIIIDGIKDNVDELDLAHFLFRIGFITLKDNNYESGKKFIQFHDSPDLLTEGNVHADDIWTIHPIYRNALCLRNNSKQNQQNSSRLSMAIN